MTNLFKGIREYLDAMLFPKYTIPSDPNKTIKEYYEKLPEGDKKRVEELGGIDSLFNTDTHNILNDSDSQGLLAKINNSRKSDLENIVNSSSIRNKDVNELYGLNVGSWNIEYGSKYKSIESALKSLDTDVISLQEVDSGTKRVNGLELPKYLAKSLNMNYSYVPEFYEADQKQGKGFTGNMILTKHPILDAGAIRLTNYFNWHLSKAEKRVGSRVAHWIKVNKNGKDYYVVNLHLEDKTKAENRKKQMEEIVDYAKKNFKGTVVFTGDYNTFSPKEPLIQYMKSQGYKGGTNETTTRRLKFVSKLIKMPLDHIFTDGEIKNYEVRDYGVSDHKMLYSTIQ